VADFVFQSLKAGGYGVRTFPTSIDSVEFWAEVGKPSKTIRRSDNNDLGDFFEGRKGVNTMPKNCLTPPLGSKLIKAHALGGSRSDDYSGEAH
jgi:hypothetical protein